MITSSNISRFAKSVSLVAFLQPCDASVLNILVDKAF